MKRREAVSVLRCRQVAATLEFLIEMRERTRAVLEAPQRYIRNLAASKEFSARIPWVDFRISSSTWC